MCAIWSRSTGTYAMRWRGIQISHAARARFTVFSIGTVRVRTQVLRYVGSISTLKFYVQRGGGILNAYAVRG